MLKSLIDKFNNTTIALNWLKHESPNDKVIFACPATVLESKSIASAQWYQRIGERRVTFMLTKNQLVLKNQLISPFTVLYTFLIIAFSIIYLLSKELYTLLLALVWLLQMVQQLPYQRRILYSDIRKIILDSRGGVRTDLIIDTPVRVTHTSFARTLPSEALHVITSRTKTVVYS